MFKSKRALCVVLVLASVGIGYGAAHKIKSFTPYNGENADADGMATLNYAQGEGKTVIQILLTNFAPNTYYDFAICLGSTVSSTNGCQGGLVGKSDWQAILTDDNGHAVVHHPIEGIDASGANAILICAPDPNSSCVGVTCGECPSHFGGAGQVRAIGVPN